LTAAIIPRVVPGRDQNEPIAGKDAILTCHRVGLFGAVHLGLVGAGEHVGFGALAELRGQLARGAKVEGQLGTRIGLLGGGSRRSRKTSGTRALTNI
jgi:hypothetical protein